MGRKVISFFLLLACVGLIKAAVIGFNARTHLLDPSFYLTVLENANVYNRVIPVVSETITQSMQSAEPSSGEEVLTPDEIQGVLERSVTPALLEEEVTKVVTSVISYLNGSTSTLNAKLSLKTTKEALERELTTLVHEKVAAMPTCTASSTASTCIPAGTSKATVENDMLNSITGPDGFLGKVDDTVDLNAQLNKEGQLESARQAIALSKTVLIIVSLAAALFLALLALINYSHLPSIPWWIGWALLLPGIAFIVANVLFSVVGVNVIPSLFDSFPAQAQPLVSDVVITALGTIIRALLWYGIAGVVLGGILISLSVYLKRNHR